MSRPTFSQQDVLADFLEKNPGIAKGLLRTAHAKQDIKRKWDQISISLNALGGAQKDGRGWAKYWADKKCALKKMCAQHAKSMTCTGGGPAEALPYLSPMDERLVSVMGGRQFATGDSHVAINPFPGPSTTASFPAIIVPNIELDIQAPSFEDIPARKENLSHVEVTALRLDSAKQNADSVTVNATPPASQRARSPLISPQASKRCSRLRHRSNVSLDKQMFADLERKRVEAEVTTANGIQEAAENILSVANAINNLATSIIEAAQIIAQALSAAGNSQH